MEATLMRLYRGYRVHIVLHWDSGKENGNYRGSIEVI